MTIVGPHTRGAFAAARATADPDPIAVSMEVLMDCARHARHGPIPASPNTLTTN